MARSWLLAAEADKIQDFVFRSAHLAQVVGGSTLLARFCEEDGEAILRSSGLRREVIVAGGGAFRLVLQSDDVAPVRAVGEDLVNRYAFLTGGSMSVAEPVDVDAAGGYANAAKEAEGRLRQAKRAGGPRALDLMPLAALCEDCGQAAAERLEPPRHVEERPRYLCGSCRTKRAERDQIQPRPRQYGRFLQPVIDALAVHAPELAELGLRPPRDLNELSGLDPNGQVAFLVADGNAMGAYFSRATSPEEATARSNQLTVALQRAVAAMLSKLITADRAEHPDRALRLLPAIPLILAGDDTFLVLPARHALAAADVYAETFELQLRGDQASGPTVAMSVVIAHPGYPYTLAHTRAESLLSSAKALSRDLMKQQMAVSTLAFERVLGAERPYGSEHVPARPEQNGAHSARYHAGFQPYLAGSYARELLHAEATPLAGGATGGALGARALHIQALIAAHAQLRPPGLPGGRRQDLRRLYDHPDLGGDHWKAELETLLQRLGRHEHQQMVVQQLLERLGGPLEGYWRMRGSASGDLYHALPDAIEALPFSEGFA
ncbi:MAG: Cas10/Cmr2 second palm domain-containing protein [Dehalococcoidia bacterium]